MKAGKRTTKRDWLAAREAELRLEMETCVHAVTRERARELFQRLKQRVASIGT